MFRILIMVFTVGIVSAHAGALTGHDAGGGGDEYALNFVTYARRIASAIADNPQLQRILPEIDPAELHRAVERTPVSSAPTVSIDGVDKIAGNYPNRGEFGEIVVSQSRWEIHEGYTHALYPIVLHEYLGVMGIPDRNYEVSYRFADWLMDHSIGGESPSVGGRVPDYYRCPNRNFGDWHTPGYFAEACDVLPSVRDEIMLITYGPLIYRSERHSRAERRRYMNEIVPTVYEASKVFLLSKLPSATQKEVAAWQRFVGALIHQEGLWSHYRLGQDDRLKYLRGDNGHGHGLLQLDDRFHNLSPEQNSDLMLNLSYGLHIAHRFWQLAGEARCVSGPESWDERSRSTYSAYSGGPTQICRWAYADARRSQLDHNFFQKYGKQDWLEGLRDPHEGSDLDLACLMENGAAGCF